MEGRKKINLARIECRGLDILACCATLKLHVYRQREQVSVYCLHVLGLTNEHYCVQERNYASRLA